MNFIYGICHNIFFFILIMSILIFIHEMGHYLVAKFFKVHVEIFSLGFGKKICGFTDKSGTEWRISILPIGGYVKMLGDKDPASTPNFAEISDLTEEEKTKAFFTKSPIKKSLIVLAGPLANFLLAFVILTQISLNYGKPYASTEIKNLVPNMPAFEAGLMPGDIILKLNNQSVKEFSEIESVISLYSDKPILFEIQRGNEILSKFITPKKVILDDGLGGKAEIGRIGIISNFSEYQKLDLIKSAQFSISQIYNISRMTLIAIGQIITGERSTDQLSGPIKIAKYSGETAKIGKEMVLLFIAIISINLGLVNLFPIPLLDGGHLVLYIIEFILGRPLNYNIQNMLVKIGSILLFSLMIFSTYNDLRMTIFSD